MRLLRELWKDDRGAVAPVIGLALAALIASGGIAFDFARMAALDTELQNAADQAALAAATQLDGRTGSRTRATSAAQTLVQNLTYFANDDGGTAVTVPTIIFYSDYDPVSGAKGPVASADDEANYVLVTVGARTAEFALTPVVGVFNSGQIDASAFAGMSSAICNTPPVMMCNPSEPAGNTDTEYPLTATTGDGIRLVIGSATAPGNFGFLQTGFGTGAQDLARALGYNNPPANCAPTNGVATEPGDKQAVRAAFNTRFDMSESGQTCPTGGTCSPSRNSRKDLVKGTNCSTSGNQAWQESPNPYRPSDPSNPLPSDGSGDPDIMGHPRDICHAVDANGSCGGGIIGDGEWDRDAYFRVNYGWDQATWMSQTGLSAGATRYQVYTWELTNPGVSDQVQNVGGSLNGYSYPVCRPPGVVPDTDTPDRRRISMAVINCKALNLGGRESGVEVLKWMDVFLVEPAYARDNGSRTTNGDIYVELISETTSGSSGTVAGQVIRRDVPRLIE